MRLKQRFFANAYFTKKCNLRLFDEHSRNLKYITSTQQTILQNKISDDDDLIIILLNAL